MPSFNEFTFRSCNGKNDVYVREWSPDEPPRGIVQISHGIAEHIERYDNFSKFLADNGFVSAGNDHIGHGRTAADESELGFFGDEGGWDIAIGDIQRLRGIAAEKNPGLPYFLFGHSMGSFLARTYIIRYRAGLDGVILSGTGQINPALVRGGEAISKIEIKKHGASYRSKSLNDLAFGKYNDGFMPVRTASDWISRDVDIVDKYNNDPLCGYVPSAGLFRDMLGGMRYIRSRQNLAMMKKELPVLFISGSADPVGENGRGVMRAYRSFIKTGMQDVTLKLYPECRHELINELNRNEVMNDILAWIESKL